MSSEKLCGSAAHSWAEGVDTSTIITQAAPTAIAAAVKFCLFISCAPDSISDADENYGPSHHCDRGWRNCQMIVDRLDTGYAFHGNSGCFFSSSEVTNPHRSTVPSRTVTLSIDGRRNCAFNRESTSSRICESPALAAAAFFAGMPASA